MQVRHIMTREVISVAPCASLSHLADFLVDNRISAIPVVDGDAVLGMVSEADLMHRHELGTQRNRGSLPWWRRLFVGEERRGAYVEARATRVRDIMTTPVISVAESMSIG